MEFHTYESSYLNVFKGCGRDGKATAYKLNQLKEDGIINSAGQTQILQEVRWAILKSPYYCVWPVVVNSFLKMSLDFPSRGVELPLEPLLLRFSKSKPLILHGWEVRCVLMCKLEDEYGNPLLGFWVDYGVITSDSRPRFSMYALRLNDKTFLENLCTLENSCFSESETLATNDVLRIVLAICLLDTSCDFLIPDVLAKDRDKYRRTKDSKYVEKAKRRNKFGFMLGQDISNAPHTRKPHFSIRWTGMGGKIPKLVPIKGCFVNRKIVSEVPTGFMEDQ